MIRSSAASILTLTLLSIGSIAPIASGAPAGPKVRVIRVDGEPVDGAFVRADANGIAIEGFDAPIRLAVVREIRFAPDVAPRGLTDGAVGLRVVLRTGNVVRGVLEAATADDLTIKPPDFASLRIPFDAIRRVEAEPPNRDPCDDPGRDRQARKGTDLIYARSGDAFAGTLVEASLKGVVLEGNGTKQSLSWADVFVLHLDGTDPKASSGIVAELETAGGSMLVGADATGDAEGWSVTVAEGLKVSIPKAAVTVVRWSGGDFARVESLPFEATFTPYNEGLDPTMLAGWFGARIDRTPSGCPLRLAGTTYRHGIGVHAKSVIKVPLEKAYRRFTATFGIDDEVLEHAKTSGSKGDVTARVLVDGKEAWTSGGSVKGGEPARSIGPIDVTGASILVLEVDYGDDMHRSDRADWADPILVRAP